jgi:hypothetical protein
LTRPPGVTALAVFFVFGSIVSAVSELALLFPGGTLEPMWRLNPRAHEAFLQMGFWAALLLGTVSAACGLAACGLFRGRRWGYRLAVALLLVNLGGDLVNAGLGTEPRALAGAPIVALLLVYLGSRKFRHHFAATPRSDL